MGSLFLHEDDSDETCCEQDAVLCMGPQFKPLPRIAALWRHSLEPTSKISTRKAGQQKVPCDSASVGRSALHLMQREHAPACSHLTQYTPEASPGQVWLLLVSQCRLADLFLQYLRLLCQLAVKYQKGIWSVCADEFLLWQICHTLR